MISIFILCVSVRYDLDKDPHQLHNLAKESSPALKAQLHAMAVKQFGCAGATCT